MFRALAILTQQNLIFLYKRLKKHRRKSRTTANLDLAGGATGETSIEEKSNNGKSNLRNSSSSHNLLVGSQDSSSFALSTRSSRRASSCKVSSGSSRYTSYKPPPVKKSSAPVGTAEEEVAKVSLDEKELCIIKNFEEFQSMQLQQSLMG